MQVTKRIEFCAGHRLPGHEGKCRNFHGHNYRADITLQGDEGGLDSVGRLVDFGTIKNKIKGWIDHHWDHGMILSTDDEKARAMGFERVFWMNGAPTAERMAIRLVDEVVALFPDFNVHVTIWETPNAAATASRVRPSV